MSNESVCRLCGEPMPAGEEMFYYHGYSGPCPKPPLPRVKFTDDDIRRDDLPRDAFELIHDLAYDHELRDQYRLKAQEILKREKYA